MRCRLALIISDAFDSRETCTLKRRLDSALA
jgi:hypothetical protein